MGRFAFNFPRIAGALTAERMIGKVFEEAHEVNYELSAWRKGGGKEVLLKLVEELLDLIHACEAFIRLLPVDEQEVCAIADSVREKNAARGYYGMLPGRSEHDCPWWNAELGRCDLISREG